MAAIRAFVALLTMMAGLAVVAGPASAQDFSGDVDVILRANGILDINGDNQDNRITLCQNPADPQEFTVIIITSNSEFETETVNGVTKDVRINMRAGDDVVQINGVSGPPLDCQDVYPPPPPPTTTTTKAPTTTTTAPTTTTTAPTTTATAPPTTTTTAAPPTTPPTPPPPSTTASGAVEANNVCAGNDHGCHHEPSMLFPRDVRVLLGSGRNSFNGYDFGVVDDLTIRGGSSIDNVRMDYVNVWDRADVNTLSGDSSIFVRSSYFGRSSWRAGSGIDVISLGRVDLGNRPIITTGARDDRISVGAIAEGRVTINTGSGADDLQLFPLHDHEERPFMLNVIMGAHNDETNVYFPLLAGDRLNGGSGNGDTLRTTDLASITATGGPTINGYEFFEATPLED